MRRMPHLSVEAAMPEIEIAVVGGGAAGLSAAGALKCRGRDPIVFERGARVGDVWAQRYERLRLHTVYSSLAHLPLPREYPKYPTKDHYAAYLRGYARHFGLRVVAGCAVRSIRPEAGRWRLAGDCGEWLARVVVLATGQYGEPALPDWPGRAEYRGEL